MKSAVIYARVSSDRQEKEGFSIPAQIEFLKNYAEENLIFVEKIFSESETAKRAGRKAFNDMLQFCKEKNINTILVEKTDRLYRNFKDYVILEDYDFEIHLVKEGTVISKNSRSHDKFIHGIKVLMAKNYIDNLSEEVKKGMNEKVAEGYYPCKAPVGYKNIRKDGKAIIVVDEEKAPFVKRLFELYASGLSATQVRKILFEEGLYHNTKPYAKSRLIQILHDCFYIGKFLYKGVVYDGVHEPIISVDLYNKVQKMFNQSKARTHDVEFTYTGIIKCGHCGCQLTAELKKGQYIYYHCTGKRGGNCKKDYIREEKFDKLIMELLEKIAHAIPEDIYPKAVQAVKDMHSMNREYSSNSYEQIAKKLSTIEKRIDALYEDKIDGRISLEFWEEKNKAWQKEKNKLSIQLQSISKSNDTLRECSNLLLNVIKDLPQLYLQGNKVEKKQILNLIGSNFTYKDKELSIVLNSVFDYLLNYPFSKNGGLNCSMLELFVEGLAQHIDDDFYSLLKLVA
jgi:DNA invertase Pin-like site-specific DNA recombinase